MIQDRSVSVVIPVFNCERYLQEAIESVFAQSVPVKEDIVIDDGSTDSSAGVAGIFKNKIKYVYQSHLGLSLAVNRGVSLASGDFIAFLDADDIWVKDKLALQIAIFEDVPGLDMVFGHVQQFLTPELKESLKERIFFIEEIMPGYVCGTMIIRKESFLRVGLFEAERLSGGFMEWFLKAKEQGLKSFMMPEVVMKRRLHETNMGIRIRDQQRNEYIKIIKASLDRRRKKELV